MAPAQSKPIQINGADVLCFLDLPPEIRNAVYELCLVNTVKPNLAVGLITGNPAKVYRHWNRSLPRFHPKLLASCKQVYDEAMPILYGNNYFQIEGSTSTPVSVPDRSRRNGFRYLPHSAKYMRSFLLAYMLNQMAAKIVLKDLEEILGLANLNLQVHFRNIFTKIHTMARALSPLVRKLHRERKGTEMKQAIDVIEFTVYEPIWNTDTRITQQFADGVKDFLRTILT